MHFIEMSGETLRKVVNDDELPEGAFEATGPEGNLRSNRIRYRALFL